MSEIIPAEEEFVQEAVEATGDEIGMTSDESSDDLGKQKKSFFSSMTVFDAMLMLSLLFITFATLVLFFELRNFGPFPFDFPWRVEL